MCIATQVTGWEPRTDVKDRTVLRLDGFIVQHVREAGPGRIADMLSELPVLDHVGYHELFDSDHLVIVDQLPRELMLEVVTPL